VETVSVARPDQSVIREFETNVANALEAVMNLDDTDWARLTEVSARSPKALAALGAVARLSPDQLRAARTVLELQVVRSLLVRAAQDGSRFTPSDGTTDDRWTWKKQWDGLVENFDAATGWVGHSDLPSEP